MTPKILFPNDNIIKTSLFKVEQDWEVPIPGFFILAPLRKVRSIAEFTDEELLEFGSLLRKVRQGMQEVLHIHDVYLFQNEDTEHNFHLWIFPRHAWMEHYGRKIQSVRPIMEHAVEHMSTDDVVAEVRDYVTKMRSYLLAI
jgi:diadenosine tetraphosphate (Ap4A) HIT family hydrolase